MQRFLLFITFPVIAGLLLISGCKKKDDVEPEDKKVELKAQSGYVHFDGSNGSSGDLKVKGSFSGKSLEIEGTATNLSFELKIDTIKGIVGTYALTASNFSQYVSASSGSNYLSSYNCAGEIVITSIDRVNQTVSGYFSTTVLTGSGQAKLTGDFKDIFYSRPSVMTATVGATNWSASSPDYSVINSQLNINGDGNFFAAAIYLNLKGVTEPGTYTLASTGDYVAYYYSANFTEYKATSGEVKITEYDKDKKIIKGTFSFSATTTSGTTSTLNVTNGKFDIQVP